MRIKNGLETTKHILEMDEQSKIILMSTDNRIKRRALDLGALLLSKNQLNVKN